MGLPYKKLTEEEDKMRNVLDKGEYPFSVRSIARKLTKKGDYEMLEVELQVMDSEGKEVKVKDWIVFMDEMAWKFRHFCSTLNLLDKYEDTSIDTRDFLNKNGVVKLTIREYEKDGSVNKANAVIDYIKPGNAKLKPQNDPEPFIDDEIKF